MKTFLDDNFLLHSKTAEKLYHEYAEEMPIIDYHCHLDAEMIASNRNFKNLTQIWLYGDHYKWRAMRTNGVNENYCTGEASDWEKFSKWAETVPYTIRNPLYHWTHMELKRVFGMDTLLEPKTAKKIYEQTQEMMQQPEFSPRSLLRKFNVEVLCTTNDPLEDLKPLKKIHKDKFETRVFPTWRPDKVFQVEDPETFNSYVQSLQEITNIEIIKFSDFLTAIFKRHNYFHKCGCRLSDHGLESIYAHCYSKAEIKSIFNKIRGGNTLDQSEILKFKSAMLYELAIFDHEKGWIQQFHLGALRNNNERLYELLGPDTGFDSMGDQLIAAPLARLLNRLDKENVLAKTILYNVNPKDNEMLVTMAGNFMDGITPGKIQLGAAWWFLDQKEGIEKQLNALSNMGLLSRFIGMLTDSRSLLSYTRHEYFRRILCNLIANDVENHELPDNIEFLGKIVQDICYYNAKNYFRFTECD